MRQKTVFLILLILILPSLYTLVLAEPVKEHITTFSDDSSEKTVNLPFAGIDSYFEIPRKAIVTNASFNVSTVYNEPNYPRDPYVDVGGDKDHEWAFTGRGYGDFGRQNVFSGDQSSIEHLFKENETYYNKTRLLLPKNATVTSTNMDITSDNMKNITIDKSPSSSWSRPFYATWNSMRYQVLYRQTDIYYEGYISKIYYKARTTRSNAKFNYFTMKLYNTTRTSLSTTFGNNNGSNQPVTVFSDNLTLKTTSGQWFEIDLNQTFYYNNTNNLLVEITWNTDNGYTVYTDYASTKYTGCVYANSWTATSATNTASLVNDIIFGFEEKKPANVTVDIGNNGILEFNHPGEFVGTEAIPDFTEELNNLTSDLPVSKTDGYGIEFVEIPINITNDEIGTIKLSDLDIRYNLTTKAFLNPHNSNLINEMNELVPDNGYGNVTIPIATGSNSFGKIHISNISIEYHMPDVTNDQLVLLNGHGQEGICYADYENYIFKVNITDRLGLTDVNEVTLTLDIGGENLKLLWDEATDKFSELYDPDDLITLYDSSCTSFNDTLTNRWELKFEVRFNWTYPNDLPLACSLNTTSDTIPKPTINDFDAVFRVETRLNLIGNLDVVSQNHGVLKSGDWVSASDIITWSNLTAVYFGTTNIYPEDKNFNITIADNDLDSWVNSSSSGTGFSLQTKVDAQTDISDKHTIQITDIPGIGSDSSDISFIISVDADGPQTPANIVCHADTPLDTTTDFDDDTQIFVTWIAASDNDGSGVDYHAMEYNVNPPTAIRTSGSSEIGIEGLSTFYVRARDKVGNWGTVGSASIVIDLTDLTYSQPIPDPNIWHNTPTVECGIRIQDIGGSGVDAEEIEYRYVEHGNIFSGAWNDYLGAESSETIECRENITFDEDGAEKKIQWRARDLAENEFKYSEVQTLKIDTTPVTFKDFNIDFDIWHNTLAPLITFQVNDTNPFGGDSSGVDLNSIKYSTSTTGPEDFGPWVAILATVSVEGVMCSVQPLLAEGDQNFIRFNGKDIAGNEIISESYQFKLDVTNPYFSNPNPSTTAWSNSQQLQFNITVHDEFSKIDIESVRYSISTNGTDKYSSWRKVSLKHLQETEYYHVILTCNDTLEEGENNYIRWQATDTAGNTHVSEDYLISIDLTECTFHNPIPEPETWANSDSVVCSIIINDTFGSGVDSSTIEYAFSVNGPDELGDWTDSDMVILDITETWDIETNQDSEGTEQMIPYSIKARITIRKFIEGSENYICWRVKDLAGNGFIESESYKIQIDRSELIFLDPKPRENTMQYELMQDCMITIKDNGNSGVDTQSVEYRYTTSGKESYSDWLSLGVSHVGTNELGDTFLAYLSFESGMENYIQWRSKDIAGNGPFESEEYNILINSPPIVRIKNPIDNDKYYEHQEITFDARKSYDLDFEDFLDYFWLSNISGPVGFEEYFKTSLPPGLHMITLYLNDGHNHNVSTHVNITIKAKDIDNDGIPDIIDPDIDGDEYNNDVDAFPYDHNEWFDTDYDGTGDNADNDDDDDGVLDDEDNYPKDSSRWEKKAKDNTDSSSIMIVGIIVAILIVILIAFAGIKSKRKKKEESKKESEIAVPDSTAAVPTTAAAATMQATPPMLGFQQTMPFPMAPPLQQPGPAGVVQPQPMMMMPFQQFPALPPAQGMMPFMQPNAMPQMPMQQPFMGFPGMLPQMHQPMPMQQPIQSQQTNQPPQPIQPQQPQPPMPPQPSQQPDLNQELQQTPAQSMPNQPQQSSQPQQKQETKP